jgi:abscisic-aldehyde oxidase
MALSRAIEQTYYFPELEIDVLPVFTKTPSRTAMRGPSEIEASFIAETILAHASHAAQRTPDEMRELNIFPMDKLVNVDGTIIPESCWTVPRMWNELKKSCNYDERKSHIDTFNATHKGRKYRGIAMTTVKYAVGANYRSALVNIHSDGSIQITHSGTEMGQGINTKVAQAAAFVLQKVLASKNDQNAEESEQGKNKADEVQERTGHSNYYPRSVMNDSIGPLLRRVQISDTSTEKLPNMGMTGGSTTSEACCGAVMLACEVLVERLLPVRDDLIAQNKPHDWDQIIKAASNNNVNLGAQKAWRRGIKKFAEKDEEKESHKYVCFGVACSEVEMDCLTGESSILRVDIIYDCGKPLNPSIDLGQIEGGFVCGLGFFFREQVQRNEKTGATWNHGTWEYKPPCSMDVPIDMRVSYLGNTKHDTLVLSSKASGEPPLVLATSAFMALRDCISYARKDNGLGADFFQLNAPAIVDDIAAACVGDSLN